MLADIARESLTYVHNGGVVMVPLILVSVSMWALIFRKLVTFSRMFQKETPFRECINSREKSRPAGAPWQQSLMDLFFAKRTGDASFDMTMAVSLASAQAERARRYIGTIIVLAAAAPLLGLLGTVTGMISTQTGLFIAVPGLFMGNFLRRRAENLTDKMQRFAIRLVGE
jgi:biopolymer transport protein ExbB